MNTLLNTRLNTYSWLNTRRDVWLLWRALRAEQLPGEGLGVALQRGAQVGQQMTSMVGGLAVMFALLMWFFPSWRATLAARMMPSVQMGPSTVDDTLADNGNDTGNGSLIVGRAATGAAATAATAMATIPSARPGANVAPVAMPAPGVDSHANLDTASAASEEARAPTREQMQVTAYLARRYHVAHEPVSQLVTAAFETGRKVGVDPLLILAVMGVESSFNPYAESGVGAQGLMQVMSKIHADKFRPLGGRRAALDPFANIEVGARVLKDCIERGGSLPGGLRLYVGAVTHYDGGYGSKVMSVRNHLRQVAHVSRNDPVIMAGQPTPAAHTRGSQQPVMAAQNAGTTQPHVASASSGAHPSVASQVAPPPVATVARNVARAAEPHVASLSGVGHPVPAVQPKKLASAPVATVAHTGKVAEPHVAFLSGAGHPASAVQPKKSVSAPVVVAQHTGKVAGPHVVASLSGAGHPVSAVQPKKSAPAPVVVAQNAGKAAESPESRVVLLSGAEHLVPVVQPKKSVPVTVAQNVGKAAEPHVALLSGGVAHPASVVQPKTPASAPVVVAQNVEKARAHRRFGQFHLASGGRHLQWNHARRGDALAMVAQNAEVEHRGAVHSRRGRHAAYQIARAERHHAHSSVMVARNDRAHRVRGEYVLASATRVQRRSAVTIAQNTGRDRAAHRASALVLAQAQPASVPPLVMIEPAGKAAGHRAAHASVGGNTQAVARANGVPPLVTVAQNVGRHHAGGTFDGGYYSHSPSVERLDVVPVRVSPQQQGNAGV